MESFPKPVGGLADMDSIERVQLIAHNRSTVSRSPQSVAKNKRLLFTTFYHTIRLNCLTKFNFPENSFGSR